MYSAVDLTVSCLLLLPLYYPHIYPFLTHLSETTSRCWVYETAVLLDTPIDNDIPYNDFYEYYSPDFKLHLTPTNMDNQNSVEALQVHNYDIPRI